jgi:hypothetical protein
MPAINQNSFQQYNSYINYHSINNPIMVNIFNLIFQPPQGFDSNTYNK